MKKIVPMFLSLLMLFSLATVACAANATDDVLNLGAAPDSIGSPIIPYGMEIDVTISGSATSYISENFSCPKGSGNSLRYWFSNSGTGPCTVQLYKSTVLGWAVAGPAFTVQPGKNASKVFQNPGGKTFYIKVTSVNGIGAPVRGILRANQLDL